MVALNRAIAFERRHHNNPGLRKLNLNGTQRIDSVHIRQSKVHQSDMGLKLTKLLDRVAATGSLSNQDHVRLAADYSRQSLQEQRVIIDSQDADLV